jgi:hypothetical protein
MNRLLRSIGIGWLAVQLCSGQAPASSAEPVPTFGAAVVAPYGFCGRVYELPVGQYGVSDCSTMLPKAADLLRLQPIRQIYATRLNVPHMDFRLGFPDVPDRFEWFAIDYTARFWIETPGPYEFRLMSDDGSALYIDEHRIIDSDCLQVSTVEGTMQLQGGIHEIRVSYFQGPRYGVALLLHVKAPGQPWRLFDTNEFRPPPNPADWKYPNTGNLDVPYDPCKAEPHTPGLFQLIQRPPAK